VDVVLITPLEEERDAVLAKLDGYRQLPPTADDIRVSYAAELPVTFPDGATATYRVVVMLLLNMGRLEAANATGDAIRRWRPRYVWLVGIAGGLAEAGVALGDVLVADQIADYELQKVTPEKTSIRWRVHQVDPRLLGAARNLRDGWHRLITCARPDTRLPRRHIGAICTGDKVIANGLLDAYRDVWAKLVGVEMEAGGTASAAFQAANTPGFFMVRGVSDLADAAKDSEAVDRWRAYACDVAAAYAIGLLQSGPIPLATAKGADRFGGDRRVDSDEHALLRALASTMRLSHATALEADQVTEVAAVLNLTPEEIPILITRLQEEHLIQLHWGGAGGAHPRRSSARGGHSALRYTRSCSDWGCWSWRPGRSRQSRGCGRPRCHGGGGDTR